MMWFINYFHIQILVIELLFCLRLQRRNHFLLRFLPCAAAYVALPAVVPNSFFNPFVVLDWFTFGFLAMFMLSGLLIWFCFRMNIRQVVFYCCVAHTLQHMVHCLNQIIGLAFFLPDVAAQTIHLLMLIATCVVVYRLLRDRFPGSETVDIQNNYLLLFALASTLIVYVVSLWTTMKEQATIGLYFFDFFSCLMLVILLLDLFRIRRAERDQMIMERLLRQEQEQHEISRATIDVINRKCHDLRHQIAALRHMGEEEKEKSIRRLEKAVMIYDSFPKSGNPDLDIVLAEKSLLAEQQHVSVRCIVDGSKLTFLDLEDMYSLMGNALDNAIEATSKEEKEAKRIVTLYAAAKGNLYSIHLENPCARQPLFMDDLPVTSKPDTDYHGFGMRSMRYLCEKYGGALTAGWEDGIFSLDMLFPMQQAEKQPVSPA
ncbi:MAG: ATP-binding protein [Faecousia sp.]